MTQFTKHAYLHVYCDSNHPSILKTAIELSHRGEHDDERFEHLFKFVRDQIPFGFPPVWDRVKASQTLDYGMGYCNTKSILLVALCRAAGIPARLHAGLIDVQIMKGIMPNWVFPVMPKYVSHMWIEVRLFDGWHSVDAHILDHQFFQATQINLDDPTTDIGYGIAYLLPSCDGNWDGGFIQSNAVVEDHGTWDDASGYYASSSYVAMKKWQLSTYPVLKMISNRNVLKIRSRYVKEEITKTKKTKEEVTTR